MSNYLGDMLDSTKSLLLKLYGENRDFGSLNALRKYYHDQLDNNSIFALAWLFMNSLYFDLQLNESTRVLPVCYEKTVRGPEFVFKRICKFLGTEYQPQMISIIHANSVKKHKTPEIDEKIEYECHCLYEKLIEDTDRKYLLSESVIGRFMSSVKKMFIDSGLIC